MPGPCRQYARLARRAFDAIADSASPMTMADLVERLDPASPPRVRQVLEGLLRRRRISCVAVRGTVRRRGKWVEHLRYGFIDARTLRPRFNPEDPCP